MNETNPYNSLLPIMQKHGSHVTSREFHSAVNKAYHAAEARDYDVRHSDMFREENHIWKTLFSLLPEHPLKLSFLDIGCGTGLVGHFAVSYCRERIHSICMLDTSEEMLAFARKRSEAWKCDVRFHQGEIFSITGDTQFDVVTMNSVLHHIVDHGPFLAAVQDRIRTGGILITSQDPRSGAQLDGTLSSRHERCRRRVENGRFYLKKLRRNWLGRIRTVLHITRHNPLETAVNEALMADGIIDNPMDITSIWAVTDYHVPNQPWCLGFGLDFRRLSLYMPDMDLVRYWTYNFHGIPWSSLTSKERRDEIRLWNAGDRHGAQFSAVWRKN